MNKNPYYCDPIDSLMVEEERLSNRLQQLNYIDSWTIKEHREYSAAKEQLRAIRAEKKRQQQIVTGKQ